MALIALLIALIISVFSGVDAADSSKWSPPPGYVNKTCYTAEELKALNDYEGDKSTTISGRVCQKWSLDTLYVNYVKGTLKEDHNYCRNPDKQPAGPWCYTTDSKVRWEPCFSVCEDPQNADVCYPRASLKNITDYPNRNKTVSGLACQKWSANSPNAHDYGAIGDHNFCRNPDNANTGPWCYTTDAKVKSEPCFVACEDYNQVAGEGIMVIPKGGTAAPTTPLPKAKWSPPLGYVEKTCYNDDELKALDDYKGNKATTISGRDCQKWSMDTPHVNYVKGTLKEDHNYCRNPSKEKYGPWCYTMNPLFRWEPCFSSCQDQPDSDVCYPSGIMKNITDYPNRNKTAIGLECQNWSKNSPHDHIYGALGDHNFCRNPDNSDIGPWCYTTDPNTKSAACFVPCEDYNMLGGEGIAAIPKGATPAPGGGPKPPRGIISATVPPTAPWSPPPEYVQKTCYTADELKSLDYTGKESKTLSGRDCQKWSVDTPHVNFVKGTLKEDHNYCRNPDKGPQGPWCYTTDPNHRWEPCFMKCEDEGICFLPGRLKTLTSFPNRNTTLSGLSCQKWSSNTPHRHKFGALGDHNYCRNPDGSDFGPWCFTNSPVVRWESCFAQCDGADAAVGAPGASELPNAPTGIPGIHDATVVPGGGEAATAAPLSPWSPPPAYVEKTCYTADELKALDYTGNWSKTISGRACQKWSVDKPHENFVKGTLKEDHNYCRNPDKGPQGPWCYTTDPSHRWEPCFAKCEDEGLCFPLSYMKDAKYYPNRSTTVSGLQCQKWSSNSPHKHRFSSVGDHNYCRNPTNEIFGPWCYTTDSVIQWGACFAPCQDLFAAVGAPGASEPPNAATGIPGVHDATVAPAGSSSGGGGAASKAGAAVKAIPNANKTFVVCVKAEKDKLVADYLASDNGTSVTVNGYWTNYVCNFGVIDAFVIAESDYPSLLKRCVANGYSFPQPSDDYHLSSYPFIRGSSFTNFYRHKTPFTFTEQKMMAVDCKPKNNKVT